MAKFFVIDRNGNRHTRDTRSSGRVYSHAVVLHYSTTGNSKAQWAGSLALAQKAARSPNYGKPDSFEIIEAQTAPPKGGA